MEGIKDELKDERTVVAKDVGLGVSVTDVDLKVDAMVVVLRVEGCVVGFRVVSR